MLPYLHGCAHAAERRESDNVGEVDGDALVVLRLHRLPRDQLQFQFNYLKNYTN